MLDECRKRLPQDPFFNGLLTLRSSGAPVSDAAGCPRRCAPRRPLNAIVSAHETPQMSSFSKWLAGLLRQSEVEVQRLLRDEAALHFLMTWSLFESKCFAGFLKAKCLNSFADRILKEGLNYQSLEASARHFHQRFQAKRSLANLLHDDKTPAHVATQFKTCLATSFADLTNRDIVFLVTFVIYRYRNNIFHGNKGIASWLKYGEQIRLCINAMQVFISHTESISPTMSTREAA